MKIDKITQILREHVKSEYNISDDDQDFKDSINIFDYGYVDSFGAVELTNFVKEEFNIEITQSDLIEYPMGTLHEISLFVYKRINKEI